MQAIAIAAGDEEASQAVDFQVDDGGRGGVRHIGGQRNPADVAPCVARSVYQNSRNLLSH